MPNELRLTFSASTCGSRAATAAHLPKWQPKQAGSEKGRRESKSAKQKAHSVLMQCISKRFDLRCSVDQHEVIGDGN